MFFCVLICQIILDHILNIVNEILENSRSCHLLQRYIGILNATSKLAELIRQSISVFTLLGSNSKLCSVHLILAGFLGVCSIYECFNFPKIWATFICTSQTFLSGFSFIWDCLLTFQCPWLPTPCLLVLSVC